MINDFKLNEYCAEIAQDICNHAEDIESALDQAHQAADGSEYAIYYSKAHMLCFNCDTESGEDFISDIGAPEGGWSYDNMACAIAYGELQARICAAVVAIFDERGQGQ